MNRNIDPCDDFYEYACGGFLNSTVIPDSEVYSMKSWSRRIKKRMESSSDLDLWSSLSATESYGDVDSHEQVITDFHSFDTRKKIKSIAIIGTVTIGLIVLVIIVSEIIYQVDSPSAPGADPIYYDTAQAVLSAMNRNIDPCDDFYEYACGGFLNSTVIPDSEVYSSKSWSTVSKANDKALQELLQGDMIDPILIGFYEQCIDIDTIENNKLSLVTTYLNDIELAVNNNELTRIVAKLHKMDISIFFNPSIWVNYYNSQQPIFEIDQVSLSLPSKEYYLDDELSSYKLAFMKHLENVFLLLEYSPTQAKLLANSTIYFETQLAFVSKDSVELRDPVSTYNNVTYEMLSQLSTIFQWDLYFSDLNIDIDIFKNGKSQISVQVPDFLKKLDQIIESASDETITAYVKYKFISKIYPFLHSGIRDEFFYLVKEIYGIDEQSERWEVCVDKTNKYYGELLGKEFIKEKFSSQAKEYAQNVISDIEKAFEENINNSKWMDDETKEAAIDKLRSINNKVGYPDTWTSWEDYEIKQSIIDNVFQTIDMEWMNWINMLHTSIDRDIWLMNPQTLNAYYLAAFNEIVIPAGILQNPFFDTGNPTAMNYGSIGAVVGHELTHAFDDKGSLFDKNGVLRSWWTDRTHEAFEEKKQCMINQYNSYEIEGISVNGALTIGENIADNGGLKEAYNAFTSQTNKEDLEAFEELDEDKLFFVSFAQVWCTKYRKEFLISRMDTDPHSPHRFRVTGSVQNSEAFHETFECSPGDNMYPKDYCSVW
eukprot:TRINITY_DN5743_c0_g1_i1.p1 TRINITY_DN5743_c0_g1~~TRINITY_DN5743_c0_g1_i1.p1  ORF type:complete len:876 (-),score=174.02 TRINITY_DN5743_c0_g1_i1:18-2321(-)